MNGDPQLICEWYYFFVASFVMCFHKGESEEVLCILWFIWREVNPNIIF